MTPEAFRAWRVRLYGERGQKAAAEALGCSRVTIRAYERGSVAIPRYFALACQALVNGLPPVQ